MNLGKSFTLVFSIAFLLSCHRSDSGSSSVASASLPPVGPEIVASVSPAPDATNVALEAKLYVTFSVAMSPSSFTPATLALYQGENQIAGSVTSDGKTATFDPSALLGSQAPLRAVIAAGVLTESGQALGQEFSWKFKTKDVTSIQVLSHLPIKGELFVPITTNIAVKFSENIDPASVTTGSVVLQGNSGPIAGAVSMAAPDTILMTPSALLTGDVVHTVTVSGIADLSGNAMGSAYSWSFQSIETVPPTIASTIPVASNPIATNVPLGVIVTAFFSEALDPLSVGAATMELRDPSNVLVPGAVALDPLLQKSLTFTPASPLNDAKIYTATVKGHVKDPAQNAMGSDFSWSFKTAPLQHGSFNFVENETLGHANSARCVIDPDTKEAFAVWRMQAFDNDLDGTKTNDSYVIFGSRYDPVLDQWDTPSQLSGNIADDANEPVIAIDPLRKNVFAAWVQEYGSLSEPARIESIAFSKDAYGGWGHFSTNRQVVSEAPIGAGGKVSSPQIAVDLTDGNYRLAWIQDDNTGAGFNRSILESTIDPVAFFGNAQGWSAPAIVFQTTLGLIRDLRLTIDSANRIPYLAFARSTPFSLYGTAMSPTLGWLPPVLLETNDLSTLSTNMDSPQLSFDSAAGDALVVWQQKQAAGNQVKFDVLFQRFRLDATSQAIVFPNCPNPTVAPCPTTLNFSTVNHAGAPSLAVDPAGNVMVAWSQNIPSPPGDGQNSIYAALFPPGASTNPARLICENVNTIPCDNPQIAFAGPNDANFFLTFTQDTGGKGGMWKSLYQSGLGWSNPALNLEPLAGLPAASETGNVLVSDGEGLGFCIWERVPPGTGAIRSLVSNRFP